MRIILPLLFIIHSSSYAQDTKQVKASSLDGKVTYKYHVKSSDSLVKHGNYEEYIDTFLMVRGHFKDDLRDSLWKFRFPHSPIHFEGTYRDEKKHGDWKYYKNKHLFCTLTYKNDTLENPEAPSCDTLAVPEQMPEFSGWDVMGYIRKNVRYPSSSKEKGISGTVYVEFIVNKEGEVTNVAVVKGVLNGRVLEEEAVRVVKTIPRYSPGFKNSKPVPVKFTFPVKYTMK